MIHLRIIAPEREAHDALELLCEADSVLNVVHLHGASRKPAGDVILCDVAREAASVVIEDLKELGIARSGSIAWRSWTGRGPEFGPLAGICVAIVNGRRDPAKRSLTALALGFPPGIAVCSWRWSPARPECCR